MIRSVELYSERLATSGSHALAIGLLGEGPLSAQSICQSRKSDYHRIVETTITATELARNLSDILNRVRYKGERFRIERNGEVVATLEPTPRRKATTVAEFIEFMERVPKPDSDFWNDVERAHNEMNTPLSPPPEWPS